ncbi:ABC transporter permease [Pseudonocardia sp. CA-107938]|uniref:ABC transporter permease n=1 Tax=Pseudonocardia sp. CA-107938 TaxID=3240021 RepID=UPI003D94777C
MTAVATDRTVTRTEPRPAPVPVPARRPGRRPAALLGTVVQRSIAIVAFLAVWEVVPLVGIVDRTWLPPFSRVLASWFALAASGQLGEHIVVSLQRSLAGFVIAIAVAVPLGLLIAWYRPVADVLDPLLEVFRNTAALALLPVFTLILGIGETSKIALIVFACLWPILLNTISGVRGVDPLLIKSARSVGLPSVRLFQKVILPAALPTIFTGIRLAGAVSILMLIAADMVGAKSGLGYLINNTQFNFQIPEMYAGIVTVSAIGVAFNYGLVRIERRLSRWRHG